MTKSDVIVHLGIMQVASNHYEYQLSCRGQSIERRYDKAARVARKS